MKLAPIGVLTYSRIDHLKKTIEALKANILAKESDLYVFLDAPKKGDEVIVGRVREYAHSITGFKTINIIERKENNRLKNYFDGASYLLNKYGKMIFLEDDNVVSAYFLKYMNTALEFYKENKKIIAISGYNLLVKPYFEYNHSYYLSIYFNAWGYATWLDRGSLEVEKYRNQYNEMMSDRVLYNKVKKAHPGLIKGLKRIHDGNLDAGDYKLVFHQIKNDLYVVKPIQSFVNNIGFDGSGVHCGISDKYTNIELNKDKIKFIKGLEYNKEIDRFYFKQATKNENIFKRIRQKFLKIIKAL